MIRISRRDLVKALSMGGVLAAIRPDLVQEIAKADSNSNGPISANEQYGGFLFLPYGTAVPTFIKQPDTGIPIVCAVGGPPVSESTAMYPESNQYATHTDIRQHARLPLATIERSHFGLDDGGGFTLGYKWAGTVLACQVFKVQTPLACDAKVELWSSTQFPQPYPMWFDPHLPLVDTPGQPEKVGWLPTSGLRVKSGLGLAHTSLGYTFYWTSSGLLHWLIIEDYSTQDRANRIASTLSLAS